MFETENNKEAIEILKRIKVLEPDEVKDSLNDDDKDEKHGKKEPSQVKGILFTMLGITTIGVIGYQGFNVLQENSGDQTQITTLVKSIEIQNTAKKEEIEPVLETLPVQTEAKNTEELNKSLIASTTTPIKTVEPVEPIVERKETVTPKEIEKKEIIKKVKPRITIVKEGDTLASIAEKFYGNPMDFKRIIRANPSIKNQHTNLHLGDKIIVPKMENSKKRRMVIIRKGYTLASLSEKFYGNINQVQKIVDANYNIKNKDSILHLGQKVYLPK